MTLNSEDTMSPLPSLTVSPPDRVAAAGPLVALLLLAIAAANLYLLGWFVPSIVTRSEPSAGLRASVGEVFGNAPTAGRVFLGRAR